MLLLISFGNVSEPDRALGLLDFEDDSFAWITMSKIDRPITGAAGVCSVDDHYFVLVQHPQKSSSLVVLNRYLEVERYLPLAKTKDARSITFHQGSFYVVSGGTNAIIRIGLDGYEITEEIYWQVGPGNDIFHLSSIAVRDDHLFVSMFGDKAAGGWQFSHAGLVVDLSANAGVAADISQPHSLHHYNNNLYVLESTTGKLIDIGEQEIAREPLVPGYARGLVMTGSATYVGVSEMPGQSGSSDISLAESFIYKIDNTSKESTRKSMTALGAEIIDMASVDRVPDFFGAKMWSEQTELWFAMLKRRASAGTAETIEERQPEASQDTPVADGKAEVDRPEAKRVDYYRLTNPYLFNAINPVGKRILEIGCGAGMLGGALKSKGAVYCAGVEVVPRVAQEARLHLDEVICGDIESLDLPYAAGSFDYLLFGDVLEHLVNPAAVLKKLRPLLQKEGRLVASIPNVAHISILAELMSGRWRYQQAGLLDSTHLRFFTLQEILVMLEETGYKLQGAWSVPLNNSPFLEAFITRLDAVRQEFSLGSQAFIEQSKAYQYIIEAAISV